MGTAGDIVTTALQNLGVIALEEQPTSAESNNGLNALNGLIETLNTESLIIYNIQPEVFPFIPGKLSYTIGTGGDFDTERPVKIEKAYSRSSQNVDLGMSIIDYDVYADISSKEITSSIPVYLYDDGNFPLKNLFFWPIPSDESYSVVLWMWKALANLPNLITELVLPPGYQRMLEWNLTLELGPRMGRSVSPEISALAASSKAQIKRQNYVIPEVKFDTALTGSRRMMTKADFLTGPYSG